MFKVFSNVRVNVPKTPKPYRKQKPLTMYCVVLCTNTRT